MTLDKIFVNVFFLLSITLSADVRLRPLYTEHITQYEQKISHELTYNNYIRKAIATSLLLTAGYTTYCLFSSSTNTNENGSKQEIETLSYQMMLKINQKLDEDAFYRAEQGYGQPKNWRQWAKSLSGWFGTTAFIAFIGYIITNSMNPFMKYFKLFDEKVDTLVSKIYYQPNISWFLASHCSLTPLFTVLESEATKLQLPSDQLILPESHDHCIDNFIGYWTLAIQQMESLLGFMQYQSKICKNAEVANRQKNIIQFIEQAIETNRAQLEQTLQANRNSIFSLVHNLRETINNHINEFALLESLSLY